jgi:hypothetical protein
MMLSFADAPPVVVDWQMASSQIPQVPPPIVLAKTKISSLSRTRTP